MLASGLRLSLEGAAVTFAAEVRSTRGNEVGANKIGVDSSTKVLIEEFYKPRR